MYASSPDRSGGSSDEPEPFYFVTARISARVRRRSSRAGARHIFSGVTHQSASHGNARISHRHTAVDRCDTKQPRRNAALKYVLVEPHTLTPTNHMITRYPRIKPGTSRNEQGDTTSTTTAAATAAHLSRRHTRGPRHAAAFFCLPCCHKAFFGTDLYDRLASSSSSSTTTTTRALLGKPDCPTSLRPREKPRRAT